MIALVIVIVGAFCAVRALPTDEELNKMLGNVDAYELACAKQRIALLDDECTTVYFEPRACLVPNKDSEEPCIEYGEGSRCVTTLDADCRQRQVVAEHCTSLLSPSQVDRGCKIVDVDLEQHKCLSKCGDAVEDHQEIDANAAGRNAVALGLVWVLLVICLID